MPEVTDKYVRIRVRDPSDFVEDSFRTVVLSEEQGIHSVMGKLKSDPNGSMVVQNYMFEVGKGWDMEKAKKWVADHKEKKDSPAMEMIERRTFPPEMRVDDAGKQTKLIGYAALFDSLSEVMWGSREKIQKGAFTESIQKDDVRMLWNHDPNFVLARNRSGTLILREDEKGLYFEAVPPDTQWAKDLMVTIKRGDVSQNSFGFVIQDDGWEGEKKEIRVLKRVKLYDVSPVTYPAYPDTQVWVRNKGNVYVSGIDRIFHISEANPTVVIPSDPDSKPKIVEPDSSPLVSPELEAKINELMKIGRKTK